MIFRTDEAMLLGKTNDFWCSSFNLFCPLETLRIGDIVKTTEEVEKQEGLKDDHINETKNFIQNPKYSKFISFEREQGYGQNCEKETVFNNMVEKKTLAEYAWFDDEDDRENEEKIAKILETYPTIFN